LSAAKEINIKDNGGCLTNLAIYKKEKYMKA